MSGDGTLLVAATELELCGQPGLVCGVGPVEAAAATARALAGQHPGQLPGSSPGRCSTSESRVPTRSIRPRS